MDEQVVGISIVLMIMVEEQTCLGIISSENYQSSKNGQCITVNGADFFPMRTLTFI